MMGFDPGKEPRMPTLRMHLIRWAFAIVTVLGLAASRADVDAMYTVTDLGALPGYTQSIAFGLNASGQVVGASFDSNSSTSFIYSGGRLTAINSSLPYAINDASQIAAGDANGINNAGQTV